MDGIGNRNTRDVSIDGVDASARQVMERLGGSLPARCPIAVAVGIEGLSGLSGFEVEGFRYRHQLQGVWALVGMLCGEGVVKCGGKSVNTKPGSTSFHQGGHFKRRTQGSAHGVLHAFCSAAAIR